MSATQKKELVEKANQILKAGGYNLIGRPKSEGVDHSVRAVSTPCGGKVRGKK